MSFGVSHFLAQSQRLWNKGYKEANFHTTPPHSTDVPWRQFSKSRPQARLWISFFLRRNTFAYPVIFTKHPYSYYRRKPFAYPFSPASRTQSEPPPHSFIISFNRLISPMRCFAPGLFLFNQEKKATVIIGEITDFRNLQLWKEFFSKYKNANTKLRLLDSVGTYMSNWTSYIEDGIYE